MTPKRVAVTLSHCHGGSLLHGRGGAVGAVPAHFCGHVSVSSDPLIWQVPKGGPSVAPLHVFANLRSVEEQASALAAMRTADTGRVADVRCPHRSCSWPSGGLRNPCPIESSCRSSALVSLFRQKATSAPDRRRTTFRRFAGMGLDRDFVALAASDDASRACPCVPTLMYRLVPAACCLFSKQITSRLPPASRRRT
jgi:hypothetical protein